VETRELRYFVAVAEELHFGRAAERLGIAQPPLSRAIRALERRLGAPLFDRTTRAVALTDAGAVLLAEGRAALDAVDAAERRTRRAAGTRPVLALVAKAGASQELLAKLLDAYAAEPGSVEVDVTLCGPGEQERVLRDGRADVALLHRPFDATDGYDTEELAEEGQALVLPAGHPLADRTELRLADVADLPLPRWPRPDGGYSPGAGPQVRDGTQLQQLVALGRAVAVLPDSVRAGLPEGIVAVPVVDAPRVTTLLAWPPRSRSRALADLVRVASRL
jgi:LysR family transcriptional regulator, benzoate and cis,cis-muconate-responsive activator of ben and cat genes